MFRIIREGTKVAWRGLRYYVRADPFMAFCIALWIIAGIVFFVPAISQFAVYIFIAGAIWAILDIVMNM